MHISKILDTALLQRMVADGYIRAQRHPTDALTIYNYTPKAVYEKVWNEATLTCRGLIVHDDDHVVARPFPKFFNLGERQEALPDEPFDVFDKVDGSLGILYYDGVKWAIATRGSFSSEQAIHATALFQRKYAASVEPSHHHTYLFEIVYPTNRIVLDYGDMDDLVLLDSIDIATGESRPVPYWPGPRVEKFSYASVDELLASPPRANAEGYVLRFKSGVRVKVKQEDYVRLHAIVTNSSSLTVWEHLRDGQPVADLLDNVPDEFRKWVERTANELFSAHATLLVHALATYNALVTHLNDEFGTWGRKEFALAAQQYKNKALLFKLLDNKGISADVWKLIRPERTLPFQNQEDAA